MSLYMCARTAARAALLVAWHEGTVIIYNYLVIPICEYTEIRFQQVLERLIIGTFYIDVIKNGARRARYRGINRSRLTQAGERNGVRHVFCADLFAT